MNGYNSVSMVILNLESTAVKESMFSRDFSLKKTSKGNIFRVAVWSYCCTPFVYALSSSPASQGWMFCKILSFLMELMVDQVTRRIQFGLIVLVVGVSSVVWVMVRPTYSDCVPVRAFLSLHQMSLQSLSLQ